ncbi:MAG: hypothetical protein ACP5H2_10785 [Solirubrobacteraceae bacterium]
MAKVVIHLFHADDDSLAAGSHIAERVREAAGDSGVELEVYCFGPAQGALGDATENPVRVEYNHQIDELVAAGVPVNVCLNAAHAAGSEEMLSARGIGTQYARDAYIRWALEGAAVLNF